MEEPDKTCIACGETKPATEFTTRTKADRTRRNTCRVCTNARTRDWYARNPEAKARARANTKKNAHRLRAERRAVIDKLKARPCADCGKTFPPYVMEFDHIPERGKKFMNISDMLPKGMSMRRILEEADKCDLVCANCHRIRTARDHWQK